MEELKVFLYRSMFKRIFLFLFPLNANLFFVLIVSNRFVEITQVKEKERERQTELNVIEKLIKKKKKNYYNYISFTLLWKQLPPELSHHLFVIF